MTDVLVVGAGSAGRRHARLLHERGFPVYLTDPAPPADVVDGVRVVDYRDNVVGEFPVVVIASPNSVHEVQARQALDAGARVLVEKPMALRTSGARRLADGRADRVMVAYNLRTHPPVERFMELVLGGAAGHILTTALWFGSYLPGWRPGVDYRQTYSARADLGGGVLLDAIHELDLAVWLLGRRIDIRGAMLRKVSGLEIDVEDVVVAVGEVEGGATLSLSLDYLSQSYRRGLEVVGSNATVRLDWATSTISVADAGGTHVEPVVTPVVASYERQADRFATWIRDGVPPPVDGDEGVASVALADAIKEVAR